MHLSFLPRALPTVFALLITATALSGCAGYRLGGVKPLKLRHVDSIAVPTATNQTLEPRIAANFTNHVIKAFQNDGTFKITTTDKADAVVELTITEIERRQLRSARFNTLRSRELEVRMHIRYRVIDSSTGTTLENRRMRHSTNIFLDPNFQSSERQAMDGVSRKSAAAIVSRIAEGWPDEENLSDSLSQDRYRQLRNRLDQIETDDNLLNN